MPGCQSGRADLIAQMRISRGNGEAAFPGQCRVIRHTATANHGLVISNQHAVAERNHPCHTQRTVGTLHNLPCTTTGPSARNHKAATLVDRLGIGPPS